jgi:hypothetical protein
VAVFSDNGQRLAQVGLGAWSEAAKGGLPRDRIQPVEYQDHLVYYAPITRTEVVVDDFNPVQEEAARRARRPGCWAGWDWTCRAAPRSRASAMPSCAAC